MKKVHDRTTGIKKAKLLTAKTGKVPVKKAGTPKTR